MEPILDETSLLPCAGTAPPQRIEALARALLELDNLGASPVVASVRDALDRDIGDGRGLRQWCYDRATPKDARLAVASRLGRGSFIDGPDGLFARREGTQAIEATALGLQVFGLGYSALTNHFAIALTTDQRPTGGTVQVNLSFCDNESEWDEHIIVQTLTTDREVHAAQHARRGSSVCCGTFRCPMASRPKGGRCTPKCLADTACTSCPNPSMATSTSPSDTSGLTCRPKTTRTSRKEPFHRASQETFPVMDHV